MGKHGVALVGTMVASSICRILWEENIALEREGLVDHKAPGVIPGTVLSDDTSKALYRELEGL